MVMDIRNLFDADAKRAEIEEPAASESEVDFE